MSGDVVVMTSVDLGERCPFRFEVGGSGQLWVRCGAGSDDDVFEFAMHSEALREFLRLGGEALREMDDIFAGEEAGKEKMPATSVAS